MKIEGTKEEKEKTIESMSESMYCPIKNVGCKKYDTCEDCLENNIEWVIINDN